MVSARNDEDTLGGGQKVGDVPTPPTKKQER